MSGNGSTPPTADPVVIGSDAGLTAEDVVQIARRRRPVALAQAAVDRIAAGRGVVDQAEQEDWPVYGLTRALGHRVGESVGAEERALFSRVTVLARAAGAGPPLATETVRAALAVRLAGFAVGGAGVRPDLAMLLAEMLNRGVHPVAPSIGSTGASDLVVMANLALPLIGEGRAEIDGRTLPGADAMQAAGLAPIALASKEGLALISSNAASAGLGALALTDADRATAMLDAAAVMSLEAFRGNPTTLDSRLAQARPQPGQSVAAARLLGLLRGSRLLGDGTDGDGPRRLQDPLSFRTLPQVHGALLAALDFVRPALTAELIGAGDNPLVLSGDREILHNANFHTPGLALGFDTLALALTQAAALSAQRTARLMDNRFTDLPDALSPANAGGGSTRVGVRLLAQTAAALVKDIRVRAQPASLQDQGVHDTEDHATMAPLAVRKVCDILDLLRRVSACELLTASQALDLRFPDGPAGRIAPSAERLYGAVRTAAPMVTEDRPLYDDVEALAAALIGS